MTDNRGAGSNGRPTASHGSTPTHARARSADASRGARVLGAMRDWLTGAPPAEASLTPGAQATRTAAVRLGDFTADGRLIYMSVLALGVGVLSAFVAVVLMGLIGLITHLAYFHTWSFTLVSPTNNTLGLWAIPIPIIGGLIIGFMARYGSERIRGHGIPEAMETILVGGSRIEPRLVTLKPLSSALSIGTGGPFGAEGPIILTGGALGSVIAQFFNLSAAERKTLLVAGAAGGMAATFNAPVSSVLLAVELLLFEFKPRSLVPVALASAVATLLRRHLISPGPMFPLGPHPTLDTAGLLSSVVVGLLAGVLAWVLTVGVYGAEDLFRMVPIHWMWWPALGGIVVGIGGVFFPRALGVGYDTIGDELAGRLAISVLIGMIVVKGIIWCIALGSGTSGGILAPLLLMGGALGGIEAGFLPGGSPGLWALIGMAAALAGVTRSPLTGVIFALELTAAVSAMLPLLVACVVAHGVTVLVLKRSILTEKVARRGFHVTREYAVDPLEVLAVREVMRSNVVTLAADLPLATLRQRLAESSARVQRLYPIVDDQGELVGVITRTDVAQLGQVAADDPRHVRDIMRENVMVAYPDETLRMVAARMITTGVWRLPVVSRANSRQVVGLVSQRELLRARQRLLEEERHRERVFRLRILAPRGQPALERAGQRQAVETDTRVPTPLSPEEVVLSAPAEVVAVESGQHNGNQPDAHAESTAETEGGQSARSGSAVVRQTGIVANGDTRGEPDDA